MEELSFYILLLKRQGFPYSPVQTKLEPSSPRSMLRRHTSIMTEARCLVVDTEVFRDIISKRCNLIILFVDDKINGESFLIGKKKNLIPVITVRSFNKRVLISRRFRTITEFNKGFLERLRYFPLIF